MFCDTYTKGKRTPLRNFSGEIFCKWRLTLLDSHPFRVTRRPGGLSSHLRPGGMGGGDSVGNLFLVFFFGLEFELNNFDLIKII